MRRAVLVLGLVLAAASPASAQPVQPQGSAAPAPAPPPAPDPEPIPEPTSKMRQPEYLTEKPSGFRLANVPAKGGAYRYRLMIVGVLVVILTALLVVRYLRKIKR